MNCLSIKQPWASLICPMPWMYEVPNTLERQLPKDVENRTWLTNYTGPLLIHASKSYDLDAPAIPGMVSKCPRGAIIGKVNLDYCSFEPTSEWHVEGYYGFYFSSSMTFDNPIPFPGKLGIFEVLDAFLKTIKVCGTQPTASNSSSPKYLCYNCRRNKICNPHHNYGIYAGRCDKYVKRSGTSGN